MKKIILTLLATTMIVVGTLQTHGQGVLVYDQQSASGLAPAVNHAFFDLMHGPLTQSFVPSLSSIGFVQFIFTPPVNAPIGATARVDLWEGSPNPRLLSATLLGSTASVFMPLGFNNNYLGNAGVQTFYFPTPIALTPGQTYYLQPVFPLLTPGVNWAVMVLGNTGSWIMVDSYVPGKLYFNGVTDIGEGTYVYMDMWFREGVVVPEPSILALFGMAVFLPLIRKLRRWKFLSIVLAGLLLLPTFSRADTYYLQSQGGVNGAPTVACYWFN